MNLWRCFFYIISVQTKSLSQKYFSYFMKLDIKEVPGSRCIFSVFKHAFLCTHKDFKVVYLTSFMHKTV